MSTIDTIKSGEPIDDTITAYNAGIVKIRCKINTYCPFSDAPYYESPLNFNIKSSEILPPDIIKDLIGFDGLEGLSLSPIYNYRHMFIEDPPSDEGITGTLTTALRGAQFSFDDPPYKEDYTWIISDSFFQGTPIFRISDYAKVYNVTGNDPCFNQPVWEYGNEGKEHVQDSDVLNNDLIGNWAGYSTQSLKQVTAASCRGQGVHWRLEKKTPVFNGQDFFLEFYTKAISDDVKNIHLEDSGFKGIAKEKYAALDVTNSSGKVRFEVNNAYVDQSCYINNAVKSLSKEFNFTNQAYYCIELGVNTETNYFIVLTQNNHPTFIEIRKVNTDGDRVSFVHGVCNQISSKQLIEAKNFRITFRNHLGFLIVYFEVGGQIISWQIGKTIPSYVPAAGLDTIKYTASTVANSLIPNFLKSDPNQFKVQITENDIQQEQQSLVIPRGKIAVFGGNMLCSFSFGFLQYVNMASMQLPYNSKYSMPIQCINKRVSLAISSSELYQSDSVYSCDADLVIENQQPKNITFLQTGKTLREIGYDDDKYKSLIDARYIKQGEDQKYKKEDFIITIRLKSGHYKFNNWVLKFAKTPILTTLNILGDKGTGDLWPVTVDQIIQDSILSFTETWGSDTLTDVSHNASISFLYFPELQEYEIIKNLYNKAFYVQIEVAYGPHGSDFIPTVSSTKDKGVYISSVRRATQSAIPDNKNYTGCNYTGLQPNTYYRLITGICYGGEIITEHGKRVLSCQIKDYSTILEHKIFLNSPYFDGYNDAQSINKILSMASFKSDNKYDASNIIKMISDKVSTFQGNNSKKESTINIVDSTLRRSIYKTYYLPDTWHKLQEPFWKFKDGENYWQGIKRICETSGSVGFFDEYGEFHYERDAAELYRNRAFAMGVGATDATTVAGAENPIPIFKYTTNPGLYEGQRMYNQVATSYGVLDVFNTFKVISSSPDGALLMQDLINIDKVIDPNSVGFLGYEKLWWQILPLGTESAVQRLAYFNQSLFSNPPRSWKFETVGLPIRPKDIILVNGEVFSITNVNNNIDPNKNLWWQTVECEWFDITPPVTIT